MSYLGRTRRVRGDVRHILPSAQSVIVTATNYNTPRPYSTAIADPGVARIARYAWGDDYHEVVLRRLNALWLWMRKTHPDPFEAMVYVDTGPIQERVYAQHAGIGWIGKHTCVISAKRGSWIFLSTILCSLPLDPDPPATDHCGTLHEVPRGVPDRRHRRAVRARRPALPVLPDDRAEEGDPRRARRRGRAPTSTAATSARTCARGTRRRWSRASRTGMPRPALDAPRLVDLWRKSDAELAEALTGSAMTRAPTDEPAPQPRDRPRQRGRSAETRAALDDAPDDARPSLGAPVVDAAIARGRAVAAIG